MTDTLTPSRDATANCQPNKPVVATREELFWPGPAEIRSATSGVEDPTQRPPERSAVLSKLIEQWTQAAVRHAIVRPLEDTDEFVATVAGLRGAWGAGATADEALNELHSVLIDWATLKLDDGDRDIPDMEGIRLVLDT